MKKSTFSREQLVLGLAVVLFLLLLFTPPSRYVMNGCFPALMQAEMLQRGQLGGTQQQWQEIANELSLSGSRRSETLPRPPEMGGAKKSISEIIPGNVTLFRGKNGIFYVPQCWNTRLIYVFTAAISEVFLVNLLLILPLIVLVARAPVQIPERAAGFSLLVMLGVIFNPLVLFSCYQGSSGDCLNGLIVAFFLIQLIFMPPVLEKEEGRGKNNLVEYGSSFVKGLMLGGLIISFPDALLILVSVGIWKLIRNYSESKGIEPMPKLTLTVAAAMILFSIVAEWSLFGTSQLIINRSIVFVRVHSWALGEPDSSWLIRNLYLLLRTSLLTFPLLLPALFGLFSREYGMTQQRTGLIIAFSAGSILFLLQPRPEFANYLLTGALLVCFVPLVALMGASWLITRPRSEQTLWMILASWCGIAGYAFFLARMRVDLFGMGLMAALDKNYTRMYLLYQYTDFFR